MRRTAALLLLSFALTTACSGSDDAEKALKTAHSWSATLNLTARGLAHHELSPRYVKQVAEVAEREATKQLEDAKDDNARDACQRVIDSAKRLRAACEKQ